MMCLALNVLFAPRSEIMHEDKIVDEVNKFRCLLTPFADVSAK